MIKSVNATVQASLDSESLAGVVLAKLDFSPVVRYTNAYQSIYWDEGAGEVEYIGLGNFASMSVLNETSELGATTIQLTLSGIPNASITDIFSNEYIGKPLHVWYATLNKDTYAVEGGQAGPVLMFAGRMDFGNIEFGETATITVNATSRLADWERPRGGRFNHAYQTRHVDANDLGFKHVQGLQDKIIGWGGVTVGDPGGGGDIFDENCRHCCFTPDTLITMADGTTQSIDSVELGDWIQIGNGEEEVGEIITRVNRTMYKIIFSDGTILKTSEDHPLHVETKGFASINADPTISYKDLGVAEQLEVGDSVTTLSGNSIRIMEIETIDYPETVYTFSNSQFFANGVLVY